MSQGLLDGNGGNLTKPGVVLLEVRQQSGKVIVGKSLTTFFVGGCTGRESPVVDEANTSKRLSKINRKLSPEPEINL
jgi:hypothetical protein